MILIDLTAQAVSFVLATMKALASLSVVLVAAPFWAAGLALLGLFLVVFGLEKKLFALPARAPHRFDRDLAR